MNKLKTGLLIGTLSMAALSNVQALTINFDYSYDSNNFFADASTRNVLEAAGTRLTSRINDNLTAITSSGSNQFDAVFASPNSNTYTTDFGTSIAADELTISVGSQNLAGTTLATAGPGGFGPVTQAFYDDIISRGQSGDTQGAGATDFAPWGGSISFDSGTSWFIDDDTSTTEAFAGFDLYTVALHELGHVFGIGTSDSWYNLTTTGAFTGDTASALFGGGIALDGSASHWAEGTSYDGQSVSLDPSVLEGERVEFSELDYAALNDIGWEVTPVPVPAAFYLFGSGLLGLIGFARSRKK